MLQVLAYSTFTVSGASWHVGKQMRWTWPTGRTRCIPNTDTKNPSRSPESRLRNCSGASKPETSQPSIGGALSLGTTFS